MTTPEDYTTVTDCQRHCYGSPCDLPFAHKGAHTNAAFRERHPDSDGWGHLYEIGSLELDEINRRQNSTKESA